MKHRLLKPSGSWYSVPVYSANRKILEEKPATKMRSSPPGTYDWTQQRMAEICRVVVEKSTNGIYIFQDGKFKFVNRTMEALTGYSAEELMSMDYLDIIHPDHKYEIERLTNGVLIGDIPDLPPKPEFKCMRKDDELRWAQFTPIVIQYDGKPALLGNMADITDCKRLVLAAEKLCEICQVIDKTHDMTRMLKLITDSAIEITNSQRAIIWLLDAKGEDLREAVVSSKPGLGLHYQPAKPRKNGIVWRVIREGKPVAVRAALEGVLRIPQEDRKRGIRTIAGIPIRRQDTVMGVLIVGSTGFDSLTEGERVLLRMLGEKVAVAIENARLHSETRKLSHLLDQQVKQRNDELAKTQRSLAQAQKLAGLGQLAAGIAHEVRNPLGIINLSLCYIKDILKSERPEVRKHLKIMESEVERAKKVIENLLQFSRSSEYELTEVDINELLEITLSLVEKELRVNDINLELNLKQLPAIFLNLDEIKQAFLNIILNATQAMPDGGSLRVATKSVPADATEQQKDSIEIVFEDTGMGIPEEALGDVFDPFFTTKESGTGLGLSLGYSTVKKFGGDITIENKRGKGAVVTLRLPTRA
jgi:PAS domain S-box-containing protein